MTEGGEQIKNQDNEQMADSGFSVELNQSDTDWLLQRMRYYDERRSIIDLAKSTLPKDQEQFAEIKRRFKLHGSPEQPSTFGVVVTEDDVNAEFDPAVNIDQNILINAYKDHDISYIIELELSLRTNMEMDLYVFDQMLNPKVKFDQQHKAIPGMLVSERANRLKLKLEVFTSHYHVLNNAIQILNKIADLVTKAEWNDQVKIPYADKLRETTAHMRNLRKQADAWLEDKTAYKQVKDLLEKQYEPSEVQKILGPIDKLKTTSV